MSRAWAQSYSDADVSAILWRREAQGLSAAQIAATVGTTRSAICGLLHRVDQQMRGVDLDVVPDDVLLGLLDDLNGRGVLADEIGRRLGWNRLRVLGVAHAIRLDLARSNGPADAPRAIRPENRNGGLPLGWWAAGIWNREVA